MKHLNKNFPKSRLNRFLRAIYGQKQKVNNSKRYDEEQKRDIMKGLDMAIDILWRSCTIEDFNGF